MEPKTGIIVGLCSDGRNRKVPTALERFYNLKADSVWVKQIVLPGGGHSMTMNKDFFLKEAAPLVSPVLDGKVEKIIIVMSDHNDCGYVKHGFGHRDMVRYWGDPGFTSQIFALDERIVQFDVLTIGYIAEAIKRPHVRSGEINFKRLGNFTPTPKTE